jgi:hypothetical protein
VGGGGAGLLRLQQFLSHSSLLTMVVKGQPYEAAISRSVLVLNKLQQLCSIAQLCVNVMLHESAAGAVCVAEWKRLRGALNLLHSCCCGCCCQELCACRVS